MKNEEVVKEKRARDEVINMIHGEALQVPEYIADTMEALVHQIDENGNYIRHLELTLDKKNDILDATEVSLKTSIDPNITINSTDSAKDRATAIQLVDKITKVKAKKFELGMFFGFLIAVCCFGFIILYYAFWQDDTPQVNVVDSTAAVYYNLNGVQPGTYLNEDLISFNILNIEEVGINKYQVMISHYDKVKPEKQVHYVTVCNNDTTYGGKEIWNAKDGEFLMYYNSESNTVNIMIYETEGILADNLHSVTDFTPINLQ